MSDIEKRLREAMDGVTPLNDLALKVGLFMDNAGTASQNKTLVDDAETREAIELNIVAPLIVEVSIRDQHIASLRSRLEEAEGARDRLAKKIAACNWYWPEDDTSSEACFESAQEVLDSAYISRGEVLAVARGGVVEVTYCASLPPADEADSDDEFWVEEKTYEAASLKVADEQSRRTLASLREADHA